MAQRGGGQYPGRLDRAVDPDSSASTRYSSSADSNLSLGSSFEAMRARYKEESRMQEFSFETEPQGSPAGPSGRPQSPCSPQMIQFSPPPQPCPPDMMDFSPPPQPCPPDMMDFSPPPQPCPPDMMEFSSPPQPCPQYGTRVSPPQQPCPQYDTRASPPQQPCPQYGTRVSPPRQPTPQEPLNRGFIVPGLPTGPRPRRGEDSSFQMPVRPPPEYTQPTCPEPDWPQDLWQPEGQMGRQGLFSPPSPRAPSPVHQGQSHSANEVSLTALDGVVDNIEHLVEELVTMKEDILNISDESSLGVLSSMGDSSEDSSLGLVPDFDLSMCNEEFGWNDDSSLGIVPECDLNTAYRELDQYRQFSPPRDWGRPPATSTPIRQQPPPPRAPSRSPAPDRGRSAGGTEQGTPSGVQRRRIITSETNICITPDASRTGVEVTPTTTRQGGTPREPGRRRRAVQCPPPTPQPPSPCPAAPPQPSTSTGHARQDTSAPRPAASTRSFTTITTTDSGTSIRKKVTFVEEVSEREVPAFDRSRLSWEADRKYRIKERSAQSFIPTIQSSQATPPQASRIPCPPTSRPPAQARASPQGRSIAPPQTYRAPTQVRTPPQATRAPCPPTYTPPAQARASPQGRSIAPPQTYRAPTQVRTPPQATRAPCPPAQPRASPQGRSIVPPQAYRSPAQTSRIPCPPTSRSPVQATPPPQARRIPGQSGIVRAPPTPEIVYGAPPKYLRVYPDQTRSGSGVSETYELERMVLEMDDRIRKIEAAVIQPIAIDPDLEMHLPSPDMKEKLIQSFTKINVGVSRLKDLVDRRVGQGAHGGSPPTRKVNWQGQFDRYSC